MSRSFCRADTLYRIANGQETDKPGGGLSRPARLLRFLKNSGMAGLSEQVDLRSL